jgi:hypothetical protein
LVRNLVWVPFGHGFGREKVICAHGCSSLLAVSAYKEFFMSFFALSENVRGGQEVTAHKR